MVHIRLCMYCILQHILLLKFYTTAILHLTRYHFTTNSTAHSIAILQPFYCSNSTLQQFYSSFITILQLILRHILTKKFTMITCIIIKFIIYINFLSPPTVWMSYNTMHCILLSPIFSSLSIASTVCGVASAFLRLTTTILSMPNTANLMLLQYCMSTLLDMLK